MVAQGGHKKKSLIHPSFKRISQKRQAELLGISYSSTFYTPKNNQRNEKLLRIIDEEYTQYPFYGSRRLKETLKRKGYEVGRYKVISLMQNL